MTRRQRLLQNIDQKILASAFCMNIRMEDDTVQKTQPMVLVEAIRKDIAAIIGEEFERKKK